MPTPEIKTDVIPVACMAPDLTDEKIKAYRDVAESLPDSLGDVRDAMRECLRAVENWWSLPESDSKDATKYRARSAGGKDAVYEVKPLTDELKKKLHDDVPWSYEVDAMQSLFDRTFDGPNPKVTDKTIRDAAYHLLWHARELCLDREPVTQSSLKPA